MLLMPPPIRRILPGQLRAADDQQVLGVPGFGGLGEVEAAGEEKSTKNSVSYCFLIKTLYLF
jgi:hypothetical protein